ncbi:double-cubane-cluster-containing anaerobic reductase [Clostridium sporogenes]|uniref:double-cubane-cluster-containing anaerobic reductase n=1 Tax=Clostridium sporogenes TaxID=1509 RepID=UPI002901A823|nr:double-cubane-cluster-containing anaerobic reductase [Clostridium botulinum]
MTKLPEVFSSFSEARKQGFLEVKKLKEENKKIVGTYCVYTPRELIIAAGAIPVSLCSMHSDPIEEAEKYLPRNLCPLIKASYGFGKSDTCPYFYFSDLLVGETTCDGKKKMYEYLSQIKPIHIMKLPQTLDNEYSFKLWRNEIIALKERLEKEFNVEITDVKLAKAIKDRNTERDLLKDFYQLNKLVPPALWGMEMHEVLYGSSFKMDKKKQNEMVKTLTKEILENYKKGIRKIPKQAKRILVTGCPMGGDTKKIIKSIENNGGVVVCFENCSGLKSKNTSIDESKSPIDAITEKYLNIPCSCMSPNNGRIELLSQLIKEYKVEGIVDMVLQGCHTYNVESHKIKQCIVEEEGLPYIKIETDFSENDIEQLNTRIEAFIELI